MGNLIRDKYTAKGSLGYITFYEIRKTFTAASQASVKVLIFLIFTHPLKADRLCHMGFKFFSKRSIIHASRFLRPSSVLASKYALVYVFFTDGDMP